MANQLRVNWPADRLCHSCFYTAMALMASVPFVGTTACCPVGSIKPILDRYACRAPVSPTTIDAQPATPKVSCIAAGSALDARFATTSPL